MILDYLESFHKDAFLEQVHNYKTFISNSSFVQDDLVRLITEQSTKMEGSTLSRKEVAGLHKYGRPSGKPRDHDQMVKNHIDALCLVLNYCRFKVGLKVSDLQKINRTLLRNIKTLGTTEGGRLVDRSSGEIRDYPVYWEFAKSIKHEFMHHSEILKYLPHVLNQHNEKCPRVEGILDIYRLSFKMHYDIITIHPFGDGNSRSSRLLMNYVQGYHKQPLTTVLANDFELYKYALRCSWHDQSMEPFINYMFNQTISYFKYVIQEIRMKDTKKSRYLDVIKEKYKPEKRKLKNISTFSDEKALIKSQRKNDTKGYGITLY